MMFLLLFCLISWPAACGENLVRPLRMGISREQLRREMGRKNEGTILPGDLQRLRQVEEMVADSVWSSDATPYPGGYWSRTQGIPSVLDSRGYTTHEEMAGVLRRAVAMAPDFMQLVSLGDTASGRAIEGVHIRWPEGTPRIDVENAAKIMPVHVMFIAGLEGTEAKARESLRFLISMLATALQRVHGSVRDPTTAYLFSHINMTILPCLNPDGYTFGLRQTLEGVFINRDFPVKVEAEEGHVSLQSREARLLKEWLDAHKVHAGMSVHGGDMIINYPLDNAGAGAETRTHAGTADDPIYRELALDVSKTYGCISLSPEPQAVPGSGCVTNGQYWFRAVGTLQDYMALHHEALFMSAELGQRWPSYEETAEDARVVITTLLRFAVLAPQGIGGRVLDAETHLPLAGATLRVGDYLPVTSAADGTFARHLRIGHAPAIIFSAPGYENLELDSIVIAPERQFFVEVALRPQRH